LSGVRTRLHLLASRVHKWLAIIIGIQLLLWFASGTLMSVLPIERVRGEHLVDRSPATLPADTVLPDPARLARAAGAPVQSLTHRMLLGRPVVEIVTARGTRLFDAATGAPLAPPGAAEAERIVRSAWRGEGRPAAKIDRIETESTEYRGPLPAWQVELADKDATRVFVAADTGKITAVRTSTWRLYDFFWGLHIMDWKNHENFNTPWLLAFAIGGLVFWLGGAILLYMRWPIRRRARRKLAESSS